MANSKKIWWLLPSAALLCGLLGGYLLYAVGDFSARFAAKEGLAFSIAIILSTSQALWVIKTYPTKVGILVYSIITGLGSGALAAWLHGVLMGWMTNGMEHVSYGAWLQRTVADRWILYPALLLMFSVIIALFRRMAETEQRYAMQQDAVALLKEAELFKLRQQLQPHFLYNSLNAISSLVITAPDKAGEMISRLADFLRTAVKQGRNELVPLDEELDYLRQYLWIEAVRFGDRLRIDWTGEEQIAGMRMPPFLLQPLMENAIKFGVYGRTGVVNIGIGISTEAGMLRITIRNPYDDTMKAGSGTGFGLEGIARRMWLIYGRQDLLRTEAMDGHFTTTLLIPQ
jgi:two-component system LytT family sensor kinase